MSVHPLHSPEISDELLSAYLDGDVTPAERLLVEAAVKENEEIAWRLEGLRQTVLLLHALPQVALPRSFSLESILAAERGEQAASLVASSAGPVVAPAGARPPARVIDLQPAGAPARPTGRAARRTAEPAGWWTNFVQFFSGGSPLLRNAAAAAFALFLVVSVGGQVVRDGSLRVGGDLMATEGAAPAAEAPQAVALESAAAEMESSAAEIESVAAEPENAARGADEAPAEESAPVEVAASDAVLTESDAPASAAGEAAAEGTAEGTAEGAAAIDAPIVSEAAAPQVEAAPRIESAPALAAPANPDTAGLAAAPGMGGGGGGPGMGDAGGAFGEAPPGMGGGEAVTGLDQALAEAGMAAPPVESSAQTDAAEAAVPAEELAAADEPLSAVAAAAVEMTTTAGTTSTAAAASVPQEDREAAAKETVPAEATPAEATPAEATPAEAVPTPVAGTPVALAPADAAPAGQESAAVVEVPAAAPESLRATSWAMPWLLVVQVALAALALFLGLLWLLSRARRTR